MPKVIKNLKEKILTNAMDLFNDFNYKDVTMNGIAKKTGIAVGTLYNYYPNKKELFVDVFKMSWEETFIKLDAIMDKNIAFREKLDSFIEVLYLETVNRKGLGRELLKIDAFKFTENGAFGIRKEMYKRMEDIIEGIKKEENISINTDYELRFKKNFFDYILAVITAFPEEKELNIEYLKHLINSALI